MKRYFLACGLFFLLILTFSCSSEDLRNAALAGNWQAVELLEMDSLLNINLQEVQLAFTENGTYLFTGTLKYREVGKYRLANDLIFLRDTLKSENLERPIKLLMLANDSLSVEMRDNHKKRILNFKKLD